MRVRFTDAVDYENLTQNSVRISKQVLGRVYDLLALNIEDRGFEFDAEGSLTGIEGVPPEITDLVTSIFEVRRSKDSYRVSMEFIMHGFDSEQVSEAVVKNLRGDEAGVSINVTKMRKEEDL